MRVLHSAEGTLLEVASRRIRQPDRASRKGRLWGGRSVNAVPAVAHELAQRGRVGPSPNSASQRGRIEVGDRKPTEGVAWTIDAVRIATPSPRAARSATRSARSPRVRCRAAPPCRTAAVEDGADACAFGHADHRVGGDVGKRDTLAASQRVIGRDCCHEALADDREALEPRGHRGDARKSEVGLPAAYAFDQPV